MQLAQGTSIGRYTVGKRIGAGPFSLVYEAVDTEQNRPVALKFLARALSFNAYARAQLQSDMDELHKLNQPDIVPIRHFGQHREQVYLAMPLMSGGSLLQKMAAPIEHSAAVTMLRPVARALDAAHAAGRMHQNIKPSNVLFTNDDKAKLSDFALGQLTSANSGLLSGNAMRNATYLSPELILEREADGRSDVYALAVLLFEMVSGRTPYRSNSAELVEKLHLTAPIPRLDNSLDAVFAVGLAKRPDERPATATALLDLVPSLVVATDPPKATRRWWQRLKK